MRTFPVVSLIAAALVAAAPASAQRASLADRVVALEQRAATPAVSVDLLNQMNQMRRELQALRSQVEELQQQNEQLRNTARVQYLDLDGRLARLEGGGAPALPAAPVVDPGTADTPMSQPPPDASAGSASLPVAPLPASAADERAAYEAAFDRLRAGEYAEASRLFDAFLQAHPGGQYAPNAMYWLGESYYVTQNYALALRQFQSLLARYPDHDKASGALLKVGLTQSGLKQLDAAERTLRDVVERYPGSDAARTAADRLAAIELNRLR
jgi:tol-pal system protein YbgF